jgi:hypothetical protein
VSAYRIYRYDEVQIDALRFRLDKSLVAEVPGRKTDYRLPLAAAPSHGYGVSAVTDLDRESAVAPVHFQMGQPTLAIQ